MAGLLQYYFFPTDFYYPRPKPVADTNTADGNTNVDIDPHLVPGSRLGDDRGNNPEKTAAAALVISDVKGENKKPRGNLPRKALALSPREIGEVRRRLEAVVVDSRSKSDRNL